MKNDHRYFDKARQVALISDYPQIHVGCIAVYKGQVIAIGCNSNKTHPTQKYYNRYREQSDALLPKLHAEINCINQLKHLDVNFSKVRLYIYRLRNKHPYRTTRPCPSCMAAIKDIGIKDIYYTTCDGYVHEHLDKYDEGGVA